jgi:RIO kinase 1
MKIPRRIEPLMEEGLVDAVLCQLMSGKEAMVYVVRCGEELRCAKVYKESNRRNFHQSISYTEGRRIKNSRRARAVARGSRYGRSVQEETWQSTEVDMLCRLAAVGVRVPKFYNFFEGVLLMELIMDDNGDIAPRLNDVILTAGQAREHYYLLIRQIVRMLCAGVVHGDLSEYNVLLGNNGPVIMDLPQAVDAAGNNSAYRLFRRDVDNLTAFFSQFASELADTDYGSEIWSHYKNGRLHSDIHLTGYVESSNRPTNVRSVMRVINQVLKKEALKKEAALQHRK